MSHPSDNRAPSAVAWGWASLAISVALEMVLPGLLGYWVDRQLGTLMVFLVLGLVLGMTSGLMHLIRFAKTGMPNGGASRRPASRDDKKDPNA